MSFKRLIPAILLVLFLSSPAISSDEGELFLYDEGLATVIDVAQYLQDGDIEMLYGETMSFKTDPGPAPEPYPEVFIWEEGIEILGKKADVIEGLHFKGGRWKPGKKAIVKWRFRIPTPIQRLASEFEQDLNLHLWIDWNQDGVWDKSEKMISRNVNIFDYFPSDQEQHLTVNYVTWFTVPNSALLSSLKVKEKELSSDEKRVWIRALLSYDDPDSSPDGHCLFGDVEDYRVTYKVRATVQMQRVQ
jgi:hypothetical protein